MSPFEARALGSIRRQNVNITYNKSDRKFRLVSHVCGAIGESLHGRDGEKECAGGAGEGGGGGGR